MVSQRETGMRDRHLVGYYGVEVSHSQHWEAASGMGRLWTSSCRGYWREEKRTGIVTSDHHPQQQRIIVTLKLLHLYNICITTMTSMPLHAIVRPTIYVITSEHSDKHTLMSILYLTRVFCDMQKRGKENVK